MSVRALREESLLADNGPSLDTEPWQANPEVLALQAGDVRACLPQPLLPAASRCEVVLRTRWVRPKWPQNERRQERGGPRQATLGDQLSYLCAVEGVPSSYVTGRSSLLSFFFKKICKERSAP